MGAVYLCEQQVLCNIMLDCVSLIQSLPRLCFVVVVVYLFFPLLLVIIFSLWSLAFSSISAAFPSSHISLAFAHVFKPLNQLVRSLFSFSCTNWIPVCHLLLKCH